MTGFIVLKKSIRGDADSYKKEEKKIETSDKYEIIREVIKFLDSDTYIFDFYGGNRKFSIEIVYPIGERELYRDYKEE